MWDAGPLDTLSWQNSTHSDAGGSKGTVMADWIETQVTTKVSPRSVAATVARLTGILSAKA